MLFVAFFRMVFSGKAAWCDMGKVRRVLQQEEHHNVWRHWTKLPYESTERTKGKWPATILIIIIFLLLI